MMSYYSFFAALHARPRDLTPGPTLALRGLELPTLHVVPGELRLGFDRTFEEVGAALAGFERLLFEPDGSFVWTSSKDESPWQLDGVLYDFAGRVSYVDLKGTCPAARFDQLLAALDWPRAAVIIQLVRDAVFVDEPTFRRYAAAGSTTS